ncbi:hypothetical protein RTE06_11775, partial [Staphylococcus aureus]|nr:hypothetical protein [Staphylococcus aureus]
MFYAYHFKMKIGGVILTRTYNIIG